MFWADRIAEKVIQSGKHQPYWVDDMKTPSGRIHVGALRGVIIHDLIFKALKEKSHKANYSYVINDMDPMDGFPHYLPEKFRQYMGRPLFKIPSPEKGYSSMARLYGQEFIQTFNSLGARPKIIWSSDYYQQGKFDEVIRIALDRADKIRALYKKIAGYDKPQDWHPFQVICPQCGKIGTTIVNGWDGKKVKFECRRDLVDWAEGCGYQGEISPFGGTGKLMWKVDWAAHWRVIGVTIEWAGKDHMSEGGSYDLSSKICQQVFSYPAPQAQLYEWFLAKGGRKMSSSKGIGVSAVEISKTLPAEILRFLLVRTHYRKAIIFDPLENQAILNLFDEYDLCAAKFYEGRGADFGRAWQLSQVKAIPRQKPFFPRFRDVVNYLQLPSVNVQEKFREIKGSQLTELEKEILKRRIRYAKIWLKNYAPDEFVFKVNRQLSSDIKLSQEQKIYLQTAAELLEEKDWQPEKLQFQLYELAKKQRIPVAKAFQAIYLSLLGKNHGPKAAWLILDNDKNFIVNRFKKLKQIRGER